MTLGYPTTENILDYLKTYLKAEMKVSKKLVNSVKTGLLDMRDELPMITALPLLETIHLQFNDGLFSIERNFRLDIINKGYSIDEVKKSVKTRLIELKTLFSTQTLGWQFTANNIVYCYDFSLGTEVLSEAVNEENGYLQYCMLPLSLRSYFKASSPVIPTDYVELNYSDLLDYLYTQCSTTFTKFPTFWKDVTKPTNLEQFPALGIFLKSSDEDTTTTTSTQTSDMIIIFRIYSSLATAEIALINHLRNVETVKSWLLNRPFLDGRVDKLTITSVDYGIEEFPRAYQGEEITQSLFRSDITVVASLLNFKE